MPLVHIALCDAPDRRPAGLSVSVRTNAPTPQLGTTLTPAQLLANALLRTCQAQTRLVTFGADFAGPSDAALNALALDLLNPEALGHAATAEIRDRARMALGRQPVESHLAQRNSTGATP